MVLSVTCNGEVKSRPTGIQVFLYTVSIQQIASKYMTSEPRGLSQFGTTWQSVSEERIWDIDVKWNIYRKLCLLSNPLAVH